MPKGFKHGCLQVVAKSRCRTHRPQTTTIAMDAKPTKHTQTLNLRKARGIVRKISLMVQMGSNPHHSWLGLTEQQNLTLFRVEARVIVQGNGIVVLLQWLWEWRGSVRRKAIPSVVARIFSGDSTSPLTRKARTWCGARDSAVLEGLVRNCGFLCMVNL